jgi:F-type H+-transporting ATPase subunit gamma
MAQAVNKIKKKIKVIKDIYKITSTMKLISISKNTKLLKNFYDSKSFHSEFYGIIHRLVSAIPDIAFKNKAKKVQDKNDLYIVVGSALGLCDGYNSRILKFAMSTIKDDDSIITIGSKVFHLLKNTKFGKNIIENIAISDKENQYFELLPLTGKITEMHKNHQYKSVIIIYTKYINSIANEPTSTTILPICKETFKDSNIVSNYEYVNIIDGRVIEYEPDPLTTLHTCTSVFLTTVLFAAICESKLSENATRVSVMQLANENANKFIDEFTLQYNKLRQEQITQEVNEIVQGANCE